MKAVKLTGKISLILISGLIFSLGAAAQETDPKKSEPVVEAKLKNDSTETKKSAEKPEETPLPGEIEYKEKEPEPKKESTPKPEKVKTQTPAQKTQPDDKKLSDEESSVISYYSNYVTEYHLGPNDVISVEVFGQCPDYCKENITVPPTARISYPLIREGIMVGDRTVLQVQDDVKKKLDEFIIDPQVTVTLVKAMSARYSVMGKVGQPGIRIMDRKVSLYEAVAEAGGVLKTGDRKKVALIRFNETGRLSRQNVNLTEIENGKVPMIYLNPGDQIFVPGKGFTVDNVFQVLDKVSLVRFLFGSPF